MAGIGTLIDGLTTQHWLTIAGLCIAVVIGYFNVTGQLAQRRERKLKTYESTPDVRAVINKAHYAGGWRSVQLHVFAPPEASNFRLENWRITAASLLKPAWPVTLARAQNDDYAQAVFYPDDPVRTLNGKTEGRPQQFALEFFIHFRRDEDRGQRAKFRVTIARLNKPRSHAMTVWATVPADAEAERNGAFSEPLAPALNS